MNAPPAPLALVVLAAGLGTRFGGPKPFAPLGPAGEALVDYAAFDAARAGFGRLVLVVRPELLDLARAAVRRLRPLLDLRLALQHVEDVPPGRLPPGRVQPWGTTHAVLAAAPHVAGPFAVVNGDDFYGRETYDVLASALRDGVDALVAFPLDATRSPTGPVNRAAIAADPDGTVRGLVEWRDLPPSGGPLPGDTPVSLNAWAFQPGIFAPLRAAMDAFLAAAPSSTDECLLPEAVHAAIAAGDLSVRLRTSAGRWVGVTHPGDAGHVREVLAALHRAGRYPAPLLS